MNIVLSGHYAQEYIISVDCTFVSCKACSSVKHVLCLPEAERDTSLSKAESKRGCLQVETAESLNRYKPKSVTGFGLDSVLSVIIPCSILRFPNDSLSVFPRILISCVSIFSHLLRL